MQSLLSADTDWIRRAAATLEESARQLSAAGNGEGASVTVGSLGGTADATAAAGLVNLRAAQAYDAAAQLASVCAGLAGSLLATADGLDRTERYAGTGGR